MEIIRSRREDATEANFVDVAPPYALHSHASSIVSEQVDASDAFTISDEKHSIDERKLISRSTVTEVDEWNAHGPKDIPLQTINPVVVPPDVSPALSPAHEVFFIFNIVLAQLFSLAALSITVVPLKIVTATFQVEDPGRMSWYTAAYSLTLGTFILPAGRLGDLYGHKKIFLIGWIWFSVWSLVCGFSYWGGPVMLSACRAIQGIGPALLIPNGIALIGRTFPIGFKRNISIAIFGGCGPVGFTLGAVFSSIFAQLVAWPYAFWVLSIACVCVSVISVFIIPSDRLGRRDADLNIWERLDIAGAATGVSGLIVINIAFNQAPIVGWQTPYIPIFLVVGVALMAAFVYIELHVAVRPIVPLKGLHLDAALTLACIACGWASHGIWVYYSYLLIENIRGYSPLAACLQTFPSAPVGFTAALAVPFILRKVRVPYLMSVAMIFFIIGTSLLATAPAGQTYWANTFLSVVLMPLAMNWSFPSGTILMSNAVPREHQGIAASLVSTMVNYSISTGLGVAGTIARYVTPEHGLLAGYRGAWYFGLGLSGTGLLISFYFIYTSRLKK